MKTIETPSSLGAVLKRRAYDYGREAPLVLMSDSCAYTRRFPQEQRTTPSCLHTAVPLTSAQALLSSMSFPSFRSASDGSTLSGERKLGRAFRNVERAEGVGTRCANGMQQVLVSKSANGRVRSKLSIRHGT